MLPGRAAVAISPSALRPSRRPIRQASLAVREPQASAQLVLQDPIFGGQKQLLVHCLVMYARKRTQFINSQPDTQAAQP